MYFSEQQDQQVKGLQETAGHSSVLSENLPQEPSEPTGSRPLPMPVSVTGPRRKNVPLWQQWNTIDSGDAEVAPDSGAGQDGGAPKKWSICYLCQRKFTTSEMLRKHEALSELHKRNLALKKIDRERREEELAAAEVTAQPIGPNPYARILNQEGGA